MCLILSRYHASPYQKKPKAYIAKDDILVYKGIIEFAEGRWVTPYYKTPVDFKEPGVAMLMVKQFSYTRTCRSCGKKITGVERGIHSYTIPFVNILSNDKMCKAVIPRGSRFFIGIHSDVVSDYLLIFDGPKAFAKFYGGVQNGPIPLEEYVTEFISE